MKLLQLRTNLVPAAGEAVPFTVYTVGTERQNALTRLNGFSASQLFVTFSGTGAYRPIGQDKWDTLEPGTLLYIPAGFPHEYVPQGNWFVGYVTFHEKPGGPLEGWGFGQAPFRLALHDPQPLFALIERIWSMSGPDFDVWRTCELLFSMCVEIKKQANAGTDNAQTPQEKPARYRDAVVQSAVRFLHDHLQRELKMSDLAAHVGYSAKHLNRLFRQSLGVTPLHYVQHLRLQTAAELLAGQPGMTVRQAAAHIGMEPVYFARLFRRYYGVPPSEYTR